MNKSLPALKKNFKGEYYYEAENPRKKIQNKLKILK